MYMNNDSHKIYKLYIESKREPELTIESNGDKLWRLDGKLHRVDGPAAIYVDDGIDGGSKEWFLYGQRHREGGPAVESRNGFKAWCINGKRHREDGPAVIFSNGLIEHHLDGQYIPSELYADAVKQYKLNKELTSGNNPVFSKDFLDEL